MNRYSRRRDPVVPKVQRVELSEDHIALRLLGVGVALAIAAAAFGYAFNQLLPNRAGWQNVEVTNSKTGCQTQFALTYEFQPGSATVEYRQVSGIYTDVSDTVYQALSTQPVEHISNLATVNANPNTEVQVMPETFAALEKMEAMDTRELYYGPVYQHYQSLFNCQFDEEAEKFDPAKNADVHDFIAQLSAFAADPAAVQLELLGNQTVKLHVSDTYLRFAEENEVTDYLDFGLLKNAFILDAVADALEESGHTAGTLSSFDGYGRTLGEGEYSMNLFGQENGSLRLRTIANYSGPMALVSFRAFPVTDQELQNYYTYADGSVCAPFIAKDGMLTAKAENLIVMKKGGSCVELAVPSLRLFTEGEQAISALDSYSWLRSVNGTVETHGNEFTLSDPK